MLGIKVSVAFLHHAVICMFISSVYTQHFVMYNTDYVAMSIMFDCLHYYVHDNIVETYQIPSTSSHQIITYCQRPYIALESQPYIATTGVETISFDELRRKGVTSRQLYEWSTPVEIIEDYQWYLDTNSSKLHLFYNCTRPWFGPLCQYAFELEEATSFDSVVKSIFLGKGTPKEPPSLKVTWYTCYTFLQCTRRSSLCLDWREVCDGSVDCDEGTDEADCWQLEITECGFGQYRCHNGAQCIPIEFQNDGALNAECLDTSDENESRDVTDSYGKYCVNDPSFRCEERMCRSRDTTFHHFVCGDGQCAADYPECLNGRDDKLLRVLSSTSWNAMPEECAQFATCLTNLLKPTVDNVCHDIYERYCSPRGRCRKVIESPCPELYGFPVAIKVLGHIRFLYNSLQTYHRSGRVLPYGLCYNTSWCHRGSLPFEADVYNISMGESTLSCYLNVRGYPYLKDIYFSWFEMIHDIQLIFSHCSPSITLSQCHPSLYKCSNSTKCISKHRFQDLMRDCPYHDDEKYNTSQDSRNVSNDVNQDVSVIFEDICDGYADFIPNSRHIKLYDESDCHYWPCNNTYTRCDGFWACSDGADELGCPSSTCSALEHECISIQSYTKICLHVKLINNGIVDCLGASDEPVKCAQIENSDRSNSITFYCGDSSNYCLHPVYICDGRRDCPSGDDERLCESILVETQRQGVCYMQMVPDMIEEVKLLCELFAKQKQSSDYFLARNLPQYPVEINSPAIEKAGDSDMQFVYDNETIQPATLSISWYCNRGLRLRVRNGSYESLICLCPPAYFGNRCQFQSQRVSLTVRFNTSIHWRQMFSIVFTLINTNNDEYVKIHSQEEIEYVGFRDCDTKFNLNLLYRIRPKVILFTNYSVRVDAYIKSASTSSHHATWLFPVVYSFLPVNRMALTIAIPIESSGAPNDTVFLPKACKRCSLGSSCAGELCICPLGKFGPRCLLLHSSCHPNPCIHSGTCVPMDVRISEHTYICICPTGFSGQQCQLIDTYIDISFNDDINIPESLFIHFIEAVSKSTPIRSTIFRRVAVYETSIRIYYSNIFHLAFVEFDHEYNLIIVRNTFYQVTQITTSIQSLRNCPSIRSLLNESIFREHLLIRIKLYHIPCKENLELVCFFDEIHMCICDLNRHANCFLFNHSLAYNCGNENYCENEGHCFQDHPLCPTTFYCSCAPCFSGNRCQFSSKSLGMSLDSMLGYHIIPNLVIEQQPRIIKIAMGTTISMFISTLISSFFLGITFQSTVTRKLGCGYYLFSSAITSLAAVTLFALKFFLLLFSQMNFITNYGFLLVQCILTDFLLRVFLSMNNWLAACVATERAITVIKGIHFNTKLSRKAVKWVVLFLILFTTCTTFQDPFHRRLLDDHEDKRIWCIVSYPLLVEHVNTFIFLFHFLAPFLINIVSFVIIVLAIIHRRKIAFSNKKAYKNYIQQQFREHKHLLISPLLLTILGLPRIIVSLLPDCKKPTRNPWLFLAGYWCSYIPPMLVFPVFVLPSTMYRKAFKTALKRWRCNYFRH